MFEIKGEIGKYKILKKLGSGGFGTVYLAEDTILKSPRALKIPHRGNAPTEKMLQESILQTKLLDHPNIVKLLTVDIINGTLVMVMEYIEGTDLEKIIDQRSTLDLKTAIIYFRQILSALEFAHRQQVIHRDIRPSNILINLNNDVKITDFGTSTMLRERQYATTKIGSPPYMAPEQFEGKAVFASDIYSAACLFYEMVSGFPPIILANPMEIYKRARAGQITPLIKKNTSIPPELNLIIMKALAADLTERYATSAELLAALNHMENKGQDMEMEIHDIKQRIEAWGKRNDYSCWNCRKAMGRKMAVCPYCGEEQ